MNILKEMTSPLQQRFLVTVLIGIVCLVVGIAVFLFANDSIILVLSGAVCMGSFWKGYMLLHTVKTKQYETVEGSCIAISQKPIRRFRKIKIGDDDGVESSLLLSKQSKIKIGYRYRFYFKSTNRITIGNEYFDTALSSDCFMGFEEVGEYC